MAGRGVPGGGAGLLGTGAGARPLESSNEDVSEYTDADESISAPTEFLAEFLSSLMLKDYTTALKYCKLILQYEPNNATAKEFYPLIVERLEKLSLSSEDNSSRSPSCSGDEAEPESEQDEDDDSKEANSDDDDKEDDPASLEQSYDGNMAGLDSLSMNVTEDKSSSGLLEGQSREGEGEGAGRDSDNTTHSYSSLEDEEGQLEEVVVEDNLLADDNNGNTLPKQTFPTKPSALDTDNCNFNWFTKITERNSNSTQTTGTSFQTSSDSESPTDPVTQQTIQMLRAKFVPATN